jgi:hypothetical protein
MSTIVTTASAADFLAVVPHLVGFELQNSIVFVAFHGRRTCGAMRFDLPDVVDGGADDAGSTFYKRVATTLVGMLSKLPGVESVVPVVYTADPFGENGPPRASFVRAVIARFEFSGFDVRDALCVAADGWGSYLDEKCPPRGRPLDDIAGSPVFDGLAEHERRPLGAIDQWAALPVVAEADRRLVAKSVGDFSLAIDGGILVEAGEPSLDGSFDDDDDEADDADPETVLRRAKSRLLLDIPYVLERILDDGEAELETQAAGLVIALARLPALRDVVMLQWAFDRDVGENVLNDARWFVHGTPPDELDTAGLMLGEGRRPDPERIERAIGLLKRITALAPKQHTPPLLSVLAWLNWALGRSSVAKIFVTAAEKTDPRYGFAELMHTVLERGMLPEWAFGEDR